MLVRAIRTSLLYGVTEKSRKNRDASYIKAFGSNLRMLRLEKGLTQEELSYQSGLWLSIIGRIERGEIDPTLSTVKLLAMGLDIHPADLLDFDVE